MVRKLSRIRRCETLLNQSELYRYVNTGRRADENADLFEQAVTALIGRQRLFLEDEQWRTVPWLQDPSSKTPQSELLDILIVIPGILEDHSTLKVSRRTSQLQYQHLRSRAKAQLLLLFKWRWLWHRHSGHEVSLATCTNTSPNSTTESFGRLHFRRFVVASEAMLYNTTLMWLLALLHQLDPSGAAPTIHAIANTAMLPDGIVARMYPDHPLRLPGEAVTLREPALEICRTFEWINRHQDDSVEPSYLYLYPVGMAMTALQDDPDALAWVKALLHASPTTSGYASGTDQSGFGFYSSREAFVAPGTGRMQGSMFMDADTDLTT